MPRSSKVLTPKKAQSKTSRVLKRRALRIGANGNLPLFLFSLTGEEILQIADISRISRSKAGKLVGYQRPEVRRHIREIVEYLDGDDVIFPHPLILALPSTVKFKRSRGPGGGADGLSFSGTLEIPLPRKGQGPPAWIVDGQQRALALSKANRKDIPVPISAFVTDDVEVQREQFLRINNAKPLPRGLVTELLPEVSSTTLPPRLAANRIPSRLCDLLSQEAESPFHGMIRRPSSPEGQRDRAVVTDTSVVKMLGASITSTSGCLFPYRNIASGETDFDGIWSVLITYWSAVKAVFPEDWGKPPRESRLMHGVGLWAMGRLMDKIMASVNPRDKRAAAQVKRDLRLVAPACRWSSGAWEDMGGAAWNDLQNLPRHKSMLSNFLIRTYVSAKQGRG